MQTKMLIGGELVAGDGAATPVLDPATGKGTRKRPTEG